MIDKRLIISIINLLKQETRSVDVNDETKESLEVAIQCLQTAYDLSDEPLHTATVQINFSLQDVFQQAINSAPPISTQLCSSEVVTEAEQFKNAGNSFMKDDKIAEAIEAYSHAIEFNNKNAVYYCNRAAAFSKLGSYTSAISDCEKAISIDSRYSKAFGRMGLAYGSLNNPSKAIECYKKAVELDPSNESYKKNLKIAEEKLISSDNVSSSTANGSFDVTSLLTNPVLRNMASSMIDNPNMINLMSGLMSTSLTDNGGEREGIDALLHAGQRLAAQMHATNPQLVEQLRQHFTGSEGPNSETKDPAPPNQ